MNVDKLLKAWTRLDNEVMEKKMVKNFEIFWCENQQEWKLVIEMREYFLILTFKSAFVWL